MLNNSFTFRGVDVRATYGIIVERFQDVLIPRLRENKLVIPHRSGAIDFGAQYYDERELTVICSTKALLTRQACEELAYLLSQKGSLERWDYTGRTYTGRIYNAGEIVRLAGKAKAFELTFVCDPHIYGAQVTEQFKNWDNIEYDGTAQTPTIITIENNNAYALHGITITMREIET